MILRFFLLFCLIILSKINAEKSGQKEFVPHGAASSKFTGQHSEDMDHKAVLGSDKLAQEFDDLSPEESQRRLRVLAQKMDSDKNGFVTVHELSDWIENSLINLDKEETLERFLEIDADKSGSLTWEEYLTDTFDVVPGKDYISQITDSEDKKILAEDDKYFRKADIDNNGELTLEEFAVFQNPEHHEQMHETLIEVALMDKDKNRDGKIDLKEYMGETFDQPNSEWFITEKARFVDEYDVDKNGFLEGDEFKLWLIPDIKKTARQEAEHLITSSDENKDGNLTIDEIVKAYKTFVGSEATSFGESLMEIPHDEL